MKREIKVKGLVIGRKKSLVLIGGPCVIESEKMTLSVAEAIYKVTKKLKIGFIFKSSYDKGNRTSVKNYRGPGLKEGLRILKRVKDELKIPVLTDIHCREEIPYVSEIVDVIQIPAYLCQQTDLVVSAGKTGRVINLKKGQFLAPWDMKKICQKLESTGNRNIILTERGVVFGYNNLVMDIRSIPIMKGLGYPVFVDVTHIIRIPGYGSCDTRGGERGFIPHIAFASVVSGCDGLFLEVHPNPETALCDATSQLPLKDLEGLLKILIKLKNIVS